MRRFLLTAVVLLCAGSSLFGLPLIVTSGGTYSASTPTSSWTAPNGVWTIAFNLDNNPSVLTSSAGHWTRVPYTNFVYTLNSVTISIQSVDIAFFSAADGGLLNIAVLGSAAPPATPTNGWVILGPQAYSGPESSPTILPGAYTETANTLYVAGTSFAQTTGSFSITNAVPGTPAPPSLILMLIGLAMGMAYLTSRRFARS